MGNQNSRTCFSSDEKRVIVKKELMYQSTVSTKKPQALQNKPTDTIPNTNSQQQQYFLPCMSRASPCQQDIKSDQIIQTPFKQEKINYNSFHLPHSLASLIQNSTLKNSFILKQHNEIYCQQVYDCFRMEFLQMRIQGEKNNCIQFKNVVRNFEKIGLSLYEVQKQDSDSDEDNADENNNYKKFFIIKCLQIVYLKAREENNQNNFDWNSIFYKEQNNQQKQNFKKSNSEEQGHEAIYEQGMYNASQEEYLKYFQTNQDNNKSTQQQKNQKSISAFSTTSQLKQNNMQNKILNETNSKIFLTKMLFICKSQENIKLRYILHMYRLIEDYEHQDNYVSSKLKELQTESLKKSVQIDALDTRQDGPTLFTQDNLFKGYQNPEKQIKYAWETWKFSKSQLSEMLNCLIDFCFIDILDYCILLHTPSLKNKDDIQQQIEKSIQKFLNLEYNKPEINQIENKSQFYSFILSSRKNYFKLKKFQNFLMKYIESFKIELLDRLAEELNKNAEETDVFNFNDVVQITQDWFSVQGIYQKMQEFLYKVEELISNQNKINLNTSVLETAQNGASNPTISGSNNIQTVITSNQDYSFLQNQNISQILNESCQIDPSFNFLKQIHSYGRESLKYDNYNKDIVIVDPQSDELFESLIDLMIV